MNTQGNTYTFLYAAIMVVVVAALLSFAAMSLKPLQNKNVEVEKKKNILSTVSIGLDADKQDNKMKYIENLYEKFIVDSYIVNTKGEKVEGDAFTVDMKKELAKPNNQQKLPVFVSEKDGKTNVILPLRGKGLWGPIWGYVALAEDYNTIVGASFDHKSETPGLGAEISTNDFEKQFVNKKLFNEQNEFISVTIIKGGASKGDLHGVDAISGGTITSNGVNSMLKNCLGNYVTYFKQHQNKKQ